MATSKKYKDGLFFRGLYHRSIENSRILLPDIWIGLLKNEGVRILWNGEKGSLTILPEDYFWELTEELFSQKVSLSPGERPFFCLDKKSISDAGEIFISDQIRKITGINKDKVILMGALKKFEIWDQKIRDKKLQDIQAAFNFTNKIKL